MSLRARLTLSLAVALAVSLAFGSALAGWHAARSVRTELTAALTSGARIVRAERQALPPADDPVPALRRLVARFDGNRHVRAVLLGDDGAVLAESRLFAPMPDVPAWFRRLIAPKLPPVDAGAIAGGVGQPVIRLETDATNETGEVWGDFRDAVLVLAVFCAATALTVTWTLARALRPVGDLLSGLRRAQSGDFGARVVPGGAREIDALAHGFNRMAAHLARAERLNARLQRQVLTLQEEERADMARDLHDEIGPSLFAVTLAAAAITRLAEDRRAADIPDQARMIQDAVAHTQRHVRDLLARLRPVRAAEAGLAAAVQALLAFWRARCPDIAFVAEIAADEAAMDDPCREAAYRVVQEALINAVRHGAPTRIAVAVAEGGAAEIVVRVTDDGAPPDDAVPGFGLTGMRERVEALGGTLAAGPGDDETGWTVLARLPAQRPPDAAAGLPAPECATA